MADEVAAQFQLCYVDHHILFSVRPVRPYVVLLLQALHVDRIHQIGYHLQIVVSFAFTVLVQDRGQLVGLPSTNRDSDPTDRVFDLLL